MSALDTINFDTINLDTINIKAHVGRPHALPGSVATIWGEGTDFVQLCFQSRGCRYSDMGSCIMCDYGCGRELTADEVAAFCRETELFDSREISEVLIGTYGSALDEYEISSECFRIILQRLADSPIPMIGFETHCDTVIEKKLQEIRDYLPGKKIYIEMGFESLNDTVREKYLNKKLTIANLQRAIARVQQMGFMTILNVLLGSPFLTPLEQIEDVVVSVQWAFEHGADNVILFPMNVKPYTALYHLMEEGLYRPISHWRLIAALYALSQRLTEEQLAHVGLSWYGERKDIYPEEFPRMIPPVCCSECGREIFSFYQKYLKADSGLQRKALIENMMARKMNCHCREEEWRELSGDNKVVLPECDKSEL